MKKLILSVVLFAFFATATEAQIKYSINLLSDQETYMVSMISDKSYNTPRNLTSNIQVVVKIPFGKKFSVGEIESRISDVSFTDNSYFDDANASEPGQLIAFTMIESHTKSIQFNEGEELPLFTFKNMEEECVGVVKLVNTDEESVGKALAKGLNFTQSMTVIGARGNAFQGIENGEVDCSLSSVKPEDQLANQIKAFPVPANDKLTIEWTNTKSSNYLKVEIFDALGTAVKAVEVSPLSGFQNLDLDMSGFSSGLYGFRLKNEREAGAIQKFLVVK